MIKKMSILVLKAKTTELKTADSTQSRTRDKKISHKTIIPIEIYLEKNI